MTGLRIGINALYLIPGGVGGTEIYLRSLLAALARADTENRYLVFTNRETGAGLVPAAPNFEWVPQPLRASVRPWRLAWEQTGLPLAAARRGIDVLLNPGFTAPLLCGCPQVTVFHDLQHKLHPEHFRWFELPFWRLCLWASAHRSRLLIAVSEATRADLLKCYRLPQEKIRVVPHGVDQRCFEIAAQRSREAPEPFLLCVSTLHPHKGLVPLIHAFAGFRKTRPEFRLVLAGHRGFHTEAVERAIAESGLGDAVVLTGWVPREELYELYRRAWAFVFPSTFEGFGLPVLEALAAGVPTACSAIEPLQSIIGEAALQFQAGDEGALREALERIVGDEPLRARLAAAGPARASQFSWLRSAELTLAALREAAG
ncbi:MAG: glycosyltransferase family 1 protein [Bryobacteraceae bacterium]